MIIHGDCIEVLKTLAESSVDACVTDPPYGIGFMGREWDTFNPAKARASKASAVGHGDKGRPWAVNPNLKGRKQSPAMSPSQIEYNRSLEGQRQFQDWTAAWAVQVLRVLKPGGYVVVCGAPRSHHRMMCGLEDAGFVVRDCFAWLTGQGFPKNKDMGDGRGTALKPAHEPIALAWKPFKGTITANLSTHGTGALNLDVCRIGDSKSVPASPSRNAGSTIFGKYGPKDGTESGYNPEIGRWPANVLLDEDAAEALDEMTGELVSGANPTRRSSDKFRDVFGAFSGQEECEAARGISIGGASRFYYVAKPSREERDYGCESLTPRQRDESRKEGNPGGDNPRNRGLQPRGNFHPTVKPVELMRWLVRLVTPPGGTVLDPFLGSGTTGMACRYEMREFIGIEREAEYIEIAAARIAAVAPLLFAKETA